MCIVKWIYYQIRGIGFGFGNFWAIVVHRYLFTIDKDSESVTQSLYCSQFLFADQVGLAVVVHVPLALRFDVPFDVVSEENAPLNVYDKPGMVPLIVNVLPLISKVGS